MTPARRIAAIILAQTAASPEDSEVLEFGATLLFNSLVDMAVIFGLAHICGILPSVLVAYALAGVNKYFAGGAHAGDMLNCLLIGIAAYTSIGFLAQSLSVMPHAAAWAGFAGVVALAGPIYVKYAPSPPPQKPLKSTRHHRQMRRGALLVLSASIALGLMWLIVPFSPAVFFWAGCLALIWQSLILLPVTQRLFDKVKITHADKQRGDELS